MRQMELQNLVRILIHSIVRWLTLDRDIVVFCRQQRPAMMTRCMLILGMMLSGVSNVANAQEQLTEGEWKRGYHGFNIICNGSGLTHESMRNWMKTPDDQKVLVVLGNLNYVRFNVDNFIERGGAVLIATSRENSTIVQRHGVRFIQFPAEASPSDSFDEKTDCPIVTDLRRHPALENVDSIITNRPGLLMTRRGPSIIAYLPPLAGSPHSNRFVAAVQRRNGGKLLCVSDESVFANQMLLKGDNVLFATQAIQWLKGDNRTHLLVLSDGVAQSMVDPSDVEVILPPPSRDEVLAALKNLPPEALLDFGNAVATVVEDENMVNEFLHSSIDRVRPKVLTRTLIFLSFAIACCIALFTYIWQKKLMRQTASVIAFRKSKLARKSHLLEKNNLDERFSRQRQSAVGVMLDAFCREFAGRNYDPWIDFPKGLIKKPDSETKTILKAMKKTSRQFRKKKANFWSTERLQILDRDMAKWKSTLRSKLEGTAMVETDVVAT